MRTNLIILLVIIFCSCGRKSNNETSNDGSIIEINLLSKPGPSLKKLSELAANVDYIPFQTIESSLISSIVRKVVFKDKRIYILSGEEIMCFNMDGKFLFKIGNKGRGPEEYTYLIDFDISYDNKFLTILSRNKLLVYIISETGFTFQRSITLKDPAPYLVNLVPETNNVFLSIAPWTGTEPSLSLLINTKGGIIHTKPNCYKYKLARERNYQALNEMIAYSIKDMVCFKEEFSDTVFCVDAKDNSFKPRMILNSYGTLTTPGIRGGLESIRNNSIYIANIFETSRYVFYLYFSSDQTQNRYLFDKTTKTKYKLDTESELKDDLSGGPNFNIEFMRKYCSGGKLFLLIEAMNFKKYVAGEDFKKAHVREPKKKDELKKLADSLKETDNPILIVVDPKE